MSNQFPNPTTDVNVANQIQLAGTGLVKLGSQVVAATSPQNTAPSGVQFKPWFGNSFPGGANFAAVPGNTTSPAGSVDGNPQYGLTLSLSATGGFASTCQLTPTVYDDLGNVQSQTQTVTYKSLNGPTGPFFNPSPLGNTGYPVTDYTGAGKVASVSSSGLITALAKGQAVIEVSYPYVTQVTGSAAATFSTQVVVEVLA